MTLNIQNNDGSQALDVESLIRAIDGYGVVSGMSVSADGTDMSVDVSSGIVTMNGNDVNVPGASVALEAPDASNPRKDVIYVAPDTSVRAITGVAASPVPSNKTREKTHTPQPPDMSGVEGVILAEVWVPSSASVIENEYVTVRDIPAVTSSGGGFTPTVVLVNNENGYAGYTRNGLLFQTGDAATALQDAIDHVFGLNGGLVYLTTGYYGLSTPVQVKADVKLDSDANAVVANTLDGAYERPLVFLENSHAGSIKFNAENKQGVTVGAGASGNQIGIERIEVANAGNDGYDGTKDPPRQSCVEVRGFNIQIGHIDMFSGNTGVTLNQASDIYINSILSVSNGTGLSVEGSEHCYISQLDIDSSGYLPLSINSASDIQIGSGATWFNATEYTGGPARAVSLGEFGAVNHLNINMSVLGASSDVGVQLHEIDKSDLNFEIHNPSLFTDSLTLQTALDYQGPVGTDTNVTANIGRDIGAKVSGTPAGVLNGVGYEAVSAGSEPTASEWAPHRFVEDTNDNSLWWKNALGNFVKITQ